MLSLTMQGRRPDELQGYLRVKVEPLTSVEHGVYIDINDHYQLAPADQTTSGTSEAAKIVLGQWASSMERSLKIAREISRIGKSE